MTDYPRGLTAQQAIDHARFTTVGNGGAFPTHVDPLGLVNEAGEWLVSSYEWAWCTSRIVKLSTTEGQDYVSLPSDYGGNLAQEHTSSLTSHLELVSLRDLLAYRTSSPAISTLHFFGAVNYATPPEGGEPQPRLLLYPTPTSTQADVFTVIYTARWQYVGEASDFLVVPGYCVTLYLEVLQHIARGRMEEDAGSVSARLQGLRNSDLFLSAKNMDARTQSDYGPMTNTHTTRNWVNNYWPDDFGYVEGPS